MSGTHIHSITVNGFNMPVRIEKILSCMNIHSICVSRCIFVLRHRNILFVSCMNIRIICVNVCIFPSSHRKHTFHVMRGHPYSKYSNIILVNDCIFALPYGTKNILFMSRMNIHIICVNGCIFVLRHRKHTFRVTFEHPYYMWSSLYLHVWTSVLYVFIIVSLS